MKRQDEGTRGVAKRQIYSHIQAWFLHARTHTHTRKQIRDVYLRENKLNIAGIDL